MYIIRMRTHRSSYTNHRVVPASMVLGDDWPSDMTIDEASGVARVALGSECFDFSRLEYNTNSNINFGKVLIYYFIASAQAPPPIASPISVTTACIACTWSS